MARIRCIKPEYFTSSDITSLTPLSRLFYIALWCESDRDGRLKWNIGTLKSRYFPDDDCDISSMADELVCSGLIIIYEVDGKKYAEIPTFTQHQVINNRETLSVLPSRVKVASKHRESGDQGEGKEGREGKGREQASLTQFDEFWKVYPKKAGKDDARKAWLKIKPDDDLKNQILKTVSVAARSPDWLKDNGQFIPHAATWLNGKRWEDGAPATSIDGRDPNWVDPRWRGAK